MADAPVRFTIHKLVCDIGLGAEFASGQQDLCLVR